MAICDLVERTDQRSADERCRHAAEAGTHRSCADTDVANFGWKKFVGEDVQNRVSDADECLAKHREDNRRRGVACFSVNILHEQSLF